MKPGGFMNISPPADHMKPKYAIPLFIFLIVAGLAGNYFKFHILNLHFIFGSIFAMLALQFFGLRMGILAAAIISSYTYLTWNHPYAIITFTAEVAIVGLLIRWRKISLLMADAIYWLFIGIPIGFVCFHLISYLPVSNTMFLMAKQTVNGITNALIARFIFSGYMLISRTLRINYREMISNIMAFFVLSSMLSMLFFDSKADFFETDRNIRKSIVQKRIEVKTTLKPGLKSKQLEEAPVAGK